MKLIIADVISSLEFYHETYKFHNDVGTFSVIYGCIVCFQ